MLYVCVCVCIMYISTALQGVAVEVLPPTCQFHTSWGLNAKQLSLKQTHTHVSISVPVETTH